MAYMNSMNAQDAQSAPSLEEDMLKHLNRVTTFDAWVQVFGQTNATEMLRDIASPSVATSVLESWKLMKENEEPECDCDFCL